MQECDAPATGTTARNLIHQLVTRGPAALEGGIEVGDPVTDVMNAGTAFFEEASDRAVRLARGQQLNFRFAERQGYDCGTIGFFRGVRSEAEYVTVERESGFKVSDRYANVGNTGCLGHIVSGHETNAANFMVAAKVIGGLARGQVLNGDGYDHECN